MQAISTADGASSSGGDTNASEQRLDDPNDYGDQSDEASGNGGSVEFAAAVVVSDYRPTTSAAISTTGAIVTDAAPTLTAMTTDTVLAKADGSTTDGGTGVGVAVAFGLVEPTVEASITGGTCTVPNGITVTAQMDGDNTFTVEAVSGAGEGMQTGAAGSLAIQVGIANVDAFVSGTVVLNGADLTVNALSETKTVTKAVPNEDCATGESLGIGASFALSIIDHQTKAAVAADADITGGDELTLTATGTHESETLAEGAASGASGATVATPVAATAVLYSDTLAEIGTGTGALSFGGNIGLNATHNSASVTTGEGGAEGGDTAVGISFALTYDEQGVKVNLLRDLTSTGGAIALASAGLIRSRTDAKAAAAGAESDDGSTPNGVNDTSDAQAADAQNRAGNRTGESRNAIDTPDASGGGGQSMSAAAAIAITVQDVATETVLGDGISVPADDAVTLKALSNVDSLSDADGSANKSDTIVGAAASLTFAKAKTQAVSGDTTVTGDGITIEAGKAERRVGLSTSNKPTVDTSDSSIFIGESNKLKIGDEVTYSNGGGTSIGGLTDGGRTTKYYVVKQNDGRIKLATSKANAEADEAVTITLTDLGMSDEHAIKKGDDEFKFDPDRAIFGLVSNGKDSLRTSDRVKYSNGGGTDFEGLENGKTYYVIIDDEGDLKLAESRDKAAKGEFVEITSAGVGTDHMLTETESRAAADATSGASGGNLGVAGSLAINVQEVTTTAALSADAEAVLRDSTDGDGNVGALLINADAETMAGVDANAGQTEAEGTGVGFSFGLNISDHATKAAIQGGADPTGGAQDDVTLSATRLYGMRTDVEGGAQSTGATTIGVTVALNVAFGDVTARVGNADTPDAPTVSANGLTVQALMFDNDGDKTHSFSAEAISGASKADSLGIAGSFSLNLPFIKTNATLTDEATVTMTGSGNIIVKAESKTDAKAKAKAAVEEGASDEDGNEGESTGVGASVAIHVTKMSTRATVESGASITGAEDLTVEAKGTHKMTTEVEGGAAGDAAVTPVLAIAVAQNDMRADTMMFGWPMLKHIWYLLANPALRHKRTRAFAVTGSMIGGLVALLFFMPLSHTTIAEGVVWVPDNRIVAAAADGVIVDLEESSGAEVYPEAALMTLDDPLAEARVALLTGYIVEATRRISALDFADRSAARVLQEGLRAAQGDLDLTKERLDNLTLRAMAAATLILPGGEDLLGRFVRKGQTVAYINDFTNPLIRVVVPEDRSDLVRSETEDIAIRFASDKARTVPARVIGEVPSLTASLPNLALATAGGGRVALDPGARGRMLNGKLSQTICTLMSV